MVRLWSWLLPLLIAIAQSSATKNYKVGYYIGPKVNGAVYVGPWRECIPLRKEPAMNYSERFKDISSLVYTTRLGLQTRIVQCQRENGSVVEGSNCDPDALRSVGSARMCILKEDCVLGEWLPWRPRPDGSLVRTRRIWKLPQGGGAECDVVEEVRPTALEPTAHWVQGPWGECKVAIEQPAVPTASDDDDDDVDEDNAIYEEDDDDSDKYSVANCGGGTQRRDATCVAADGTALHTSQCAHIPMPTLVQPCEVPCPRDCEVGEWGEWSACQPVDGCPLFPVQQLTTAGYSVRRRRVLSSASGGGAPCPPLEEKRSCSTPRCASWQPLPWSACVLTQPHTTCGPGRRSRELTCVGHDGHEAQRAWCGSATPRRSERCRIACAGDCVVSSWGPWSPCSAPCAAPAQPRPYRSRRRHILAPASPNGWPCPSEDQLIQNETCNDHACATYSWIATPWGSCERRTQDFVPDNNYTDFTENEAFDLSDDEEPCVEEGEMIRDVMCVQNNADVVRDALCAPLRRPANRRACTVRCHRGCRVEAWKPWSPCPNTCEPSKQTRERVVYGGPTCGPSQETRDCPVPRSCKTQDAAWVAGEWSACRLAPPGRCGAGYRVRNIWCGSGAHRVEAGACSGQAVPRTVTPCFKPCTPVPPLSCAIVCGDPIKYLDSADPDTPDCVCKNVTLELQPADSDCILPPGLECGEGRALRAARCLVGDLDVPMDVCKKFHPLTGPNRVREASTDGYVYDEEFPSLLRGPCSVRCARDCAVGAWGEWGPCAADTGSKAAFRIRTREVIEEGSGGGRECGATLQRATCSARAPRWRLGDWQRCSPRRALCGHALVTRNVTCIDSDGNVADDNVCKLSAGPAPPRETQCRAPCPADCVVSAWSDWSPCERTKWGGSRDRTRVVLRPAEDGGAGCPHLVAAERCSPDEYSWHVAMWDDCQPLGGSPCGEGIKKRAVSCLRSDGVIVNDSFCPNTTAMEPRESWCYVPCGVDCEVGDWGPWDTSACTCGDTSGVRHMRRTRQRLTAAVWPGRTCPSTEQRAPCPREPCLRLVSRPTLGCRIMQSSSAVSSAPAADACGWGVTVSHPQCELADDVALPPWRCARALPGRVVAPPPHEYEEPCPIKCGCEESDVGQPGPWGAWGPCRNGARSRTRQMLIPPSKTCRTSSSRFVTIEWENCTSDNGEITDLLAVGKDDKPRHIWPEKDVYHDGYLEGSSSVLAVVWTSTLVLSCYGAYMLYRGLMRCLRSRRLKTITKV